jgi:lycopene beta-cyclase
MTQANEPFDCVLVGGGLANALVALAVLERAPESRVALVEQGARLGGNHTWSFHTDEVPASARAYVDPLIEYRWPSYGVRFPRLVRTLAAEYASFTSARLHECVVRAFSRSARSKLVLGRRSVATEAQRVVLDDGSVLVSDLVIDGRGPERFEPDAACRFQKFVGLEVSLKRPAPVHEPLLMDACVSQVDGFHFVYVLPFERQRVLIEDTYFSDTPELDDEELERRSFSYAEKHGFAIDAVLRRERGVLPLPSAPPIRQAQRGPLLSGVQGGWFHPTTGYSFPAAVQLAEFVGKRGPHAVFGADFARLLADRGRQQRYFCLLNRLLYGAFRPEQRFNVLERFYRLPAITISRFCAMQTTPGDRARIVCGPPPRGLSFTQILSTQSVS